MDPKRVLTFRAVAHQRSFTRAARELALSQPSVSHQVAALEHEIGARLLDRRPGGLELTPAGTLLLEHADAIAVRFDLAALQLAEIGDDERTLIRIGAFPTALAALVPSAVARLRARHPGARVTVDEGAADELPARVRSGELHVAVGSQDAALPRRDYEGIERRDLLREPFLVALAPEHELARQDAVRLSDLADEDWTAAYTDGLIVRACRAAGFEPRLAPARPARHPRPDHARPGRHARPPAARRGIHGHRAAPDRRRRARARRLRPAPARRPTSTRATDACRPHRGRRRAALLSHGASAEYVVDGLRGRLSIPGRPFVLCGRSAGRSR
jgi:DNA-binding transcriptional LysR family regulator